MRHLFIKFSYVFSHSKPFTILLRFILRDNTRPLLSDYIWEYRGNNIPTISQGLLCDMQISISNISKAEVPI